MKHRTRSAAPVRRAAPKLLPLLLPLYFLSGFCTLAVETLWIRALSVRLGNTVVTATLVLAVFFLCAALGNLWGGRVVKSHAWPVRFYGMCELLAACSAALLFPARHLCYNVVHHLAPAAAGGGLVGLHLCYTLLLVGVPSFFAGSTFPALAEACVTHIERRTRVGGAVYALNLLGAALGVVGGGLLLPAALGNNAAFAVTLALQCAIGGVAILWARRRYSPPNAAVVDAQAAPPLSPRFGLLLLAASGFLSLMLEMLVLSYFQQFTAASLYAMCAVLFAFIVNLGIGSLLVAVLRVWVKRAEPLLLGVLSFGGLQLLAYPFVLQRCLRLGATGMLLPPLDSLPAWTGHAMLLATLLFAPLLITIGMVFPLGWEIIERGNTHHGEALGHAVAINKLGSALGAFLAPFALVPLLGLPGTMMSAGWGYLGLAAWGGWRLCRRPTARLAYAGALAAVLVAAVLTFTHRRPPLALNPHEQLLACYQGPDGVTAVTEDAQHSRHIVLNQCYTLNGTQRALLSQRQESWLPLLFCAQPDRVACIGMASGISAAAVLDFPVRTLDAVELAPEVAHAARAHFRAWNDALFTDPRAHLSVNDGRFILQDAATPYDLVICDLLLPSLEGTGTLYSRDFFTAAREKLAPHGAFCLWLPMYQLDTELAGTVLRTFSDVFPHAILIRGNFDPLQPIVGLLGADEPFDLSSEFLARRLATPAAQRLAARSPFFRSVANARLSYIGDLTAVRGDFWQHPPNTDDNQRFAFLGAKRIDHGELLNGYPLLNYLGLRFRTAGHLSSLLGATPDGELLQGLRAGNYYFAAAVANCTIPGETVTQQLQRFRQMAGYLSTAQRLDPAASVGAADLGQ